MARRVASFEEMIDILSSIRGGQFVTVGYFSNANAYKTGRSVDMEAFGKDLENDKESEYYAPLKGFQSGQVKKLPYAGIVKVTITQFNWLSEENYNKAYSKYSNARDEIQKSYGNYVAPEDRKHSGYTTKLDYGKGGVAVGNTENTQGKLYMHQNGATARILSRDFYLVDGNGDLMTKAAKFDTIRNILPKASSSMVDGEGALRKVTSDENIIRKYTEEIKKLNFTPLQYAYDKILFISCTYNGEKIFFINDQITNDADKKLVVNTDSFKEIVANSLAKSNTGLKEALNPSLREELVKLREGIREIRDKMLND